MDFYKSEYGAHKTFKEGLRDVLEGIRDVWWDGTGERGTGLSMRMFRNG